MLKNSVSILERESSIVLSYGGAELELEGVKSKIGLYEYLEKSQDLRRIIGEHDMLRAELNTSQRIDALDFYEKHKKFGLSVLQPIYDHKIWDLLIDKDCPKNLILGFTLEKYHYIEGAHEHMAFAAADSSEFMMNHLAKHFIEEYTHGDIYKQGMLEFYSAEQIENSVPLPTTRALINGLSEFAMDDSFCYYAANELLQLTENVDSDDEAEVGEFYALLLNNHPWTEKIVKAYRLHTSLDQNLGHEGAFKKMCKSVGTISIEQANKAIANTAKTAELLEVFLDGILEYYQNSVSALRTHTEVMHK